ncbi:MAG TPA: hypothetical protein VGH74_16665, partial [Planctomycetaceae bacterium]
MFGVWSGPLRMGAGFADVPEGANEPNRLPILSQDLFAGKRDDVLERFVEQLVVPLLKDSTGLDTNPTELLKWLQLAVERGDVVFLLDAVDQTDHDQSHLAMFLGAGGVLSCPAIVSGRSQTDRTHPNTWKRQAADWDTIQSAGFGRKQIEEYCTLGLEGDARVRGVQIAERLLSRKVWRPLLATPLLAEQMKELALCDELGQLKNRESVYAKALSRLVDKGLDTLNSTRETRHRDEDWSIDEVMSEILAPVAWNTFRIELRGAAQGSRFTGQVTGRAYEELKKTLELP